MRRRALVDMGLQVMVAVVLGASLVANAGLAAAQTESVNRDRNGLAIDGYDPVAYQLERRPVKGTAEFEYTWNGTSYRFASAANRDTFAAHPETYAPQYGGFCAYAVSRGYTATIDPEAWAMIDGKLYLNYSTRVQRTWQADATNNIRKADANWPRLLVPQGLHRIDESRIPNPEPRSPSPDLPRHHPPDILERWHAVHRAAARTTDGGCGVGEAE